MRKANKILFIVACVVFFISISAGGSFAKDCSSSSEKTSTESSYTLIYTKSGENYALSGVKGDKTMVECEIPKKYEGAYVTSIKKGAFKGCKKLKNVTIPTTITEINGNAFSDCESLKKITYDGTKKQWRAIEKTNWSDVTDNYTITIVCSDGNISSS